VVIFCAYYVHASARARVCVCACESAFAHLRLPHRSTLVLQRRYDGHALAQLTASAEAERIAAELRGQLKLKALEAEHAVMAAADHAAAVARLTAECDSQREKLSILQVCVSAFDRMVLASY
jgi:hypothetical protein